MKQIYLIFSVLLWLLASNAFAQQTRVTGTVISAEDGSTLPGVTVAVKGATQGAVTDNNGYFELTAEQGSTLVFSFIGMETQEVTVTGEQPMNIEMMPDIASLDEVVVIGYGTKLKYELTGSISSVKSDDIASHTMPSIETALQGRTAGVHMSAGSGKLGQAIRTRIRGSSSISASSEPLYVVDGIPIVSQDLGTVGNEPTNPLADINPNDIESVDVLKDASAAAIYGSRAANGVIIITTKRGKAGESRVNFSTQIGFSEPANKVGFLNREQYIELFRESYSNTAGGANETFLIFNNYEEAMDYALPYWRDGFETNWEDQAMQNGAHRQFDLSGSGGNENTQFYASLSYIDQMAIIRGNEFDRVNGRVNLDQKVNDKLSFGMNLGLTRSRNFRVANDNAFATPLQMVAQPSVSPTHDPETGELNDLTVYENGLIPLEYNNFDTEIFRNIGNVFMNYDILPGLRFTSEAGVDLLNQREMEYQGRLTNDGGPDGYGFDRTVTSKIYNLENYFTYIPEINDYTEINFVLGSSMQKADFDFASVEGRGFPNDEFRRIASASEIVSGSSSGTGYRYISYFSRGNLTFFDRYLLSLSARVDGSSRFGADSRYGFFPAGSVGWIMTREDFLDDNSVITFLKPRFSWGVTGNSEIDNFAARGLYQGTNYAGLSGMRPSSMPSPDLRWETTVQTSVGIDFAMFNNRFSGELDYYVKKTNDLLLNVNVPATTGFTSIYKNVGNLENRGFEIALNTVNIDREFEWSTSFNIGFNQNEVTDIDGQVISLDIWRVMEGQPIGVFYTKEYAGVDPDNGDALFYLNEEGDETTNSLSEAANRIVGDPNPDFMGGLTNTFRYKGFDLSVFFQFVQGNDIYNGGRQWQADGLSWFDNQTVDFYENHWREPGDDAKYPEPRWYDGNGYGVSSMLIFDGSYVRLKEVTLGYNLPAELANSLRLQSLRIFARAYNLLTFTDYPGWDPEANFMGTGPTAQTMNIRQGYDFYTAPQPRTLTLGLNLSF